MNNRNYWTLSFAVMILILLLDQCLKIWVKTTMYQGQEHLILGLNWARIHFVENEGMAFGISLGNQMGKLLLSIFRIIAVFFLFFILWRLIKGQEKPAIVISFSMILAGAIGNILDSVFYGLIFSNSPYHGGVAELFPAEGGYAPALMGKVVDMFYFPMIQTTWPEWVPAWGGQEFEFFRPVFNVADSSIFCGICIFLIFYRHLKTNSLTEQRDNAHLINKETSDTKASEVIE
ncbi:MAG: lipoprotein signal peptidase [Saprospiraceae bacterium]|nr:lipoprotein signal peptidase [Saprospiraceae bacterium]